MKQFERLYGAGLAIALTAVSGSVLATESMNSRLQQTQTLERMEFENERLEHTLKRRQLEHEIQNVGVDRRPETPEQSETVEFRQAPGAMNQSDQSDQAREAPSEADRAQERKNRILDNVMISSVFRDRDSQNLHAELYTGDRGRIEIGAGEVLGNWRIDEIQLDRVIAVHEDTDERRVIRYGAQPRQ